MPVLRHRQARHTRLEVDPVPFEAGDLSGPHGCLAREPERMEGSPLGRGQVVASHMGQPVDFILRRQPIARRRLGRFAHVLDGVRR